MADFFISYTSSDAAWAEWVAWHLEQNGYEVIVQQWDFKPGKNFVVSIQEAFAKARTTLAILSEQYLERMYTIAEWSAAFTKGADGKNRSLIPIRVTKVKPDGLLSAVVYIDLSDEVNEDFAINKLLKGVSSNRNKPSEPPKFPSVSSNDPVLPPAFPSGKMTIGKQISTRKRFICQKISKSQILNLENVDHPYSALSDPTEFIEIEGESTVNCVLWLPGSQYIKTSQLQRYTPAVAVCFDGNSSIHNGNKMRISENLKRLLSIRASKLRNDERERLFSELGEVLQESFVAAVTLPKLMLSAGKRNPMLAYSAFLDMLLMPLVQMHKKNGVDKFNLILSEIGEHNRGVIGSSKKILKAVYHEKHAFQVMEAGKDEKWPVVADIARLIAWGVNVAHNQQNDKWLLYFEKGMEEAASSHMDEAASK